MPCEEARRCAAEIARTVLFAGGVSVREHADRGLRRRLRQGGRASACVMRSPLTVSFGRTSLVFTFAHGALLMLKLRVVHVKCTATSSSPTTASRSTTRRHRCAPTGRRRTVPRSETETFQRDTHASRAESSHFSACRADRAQGALLKQRATRSPGRRRPSSFQVAGSRFAANFSLFRPLCRDRSPGSEDPQAKHADRDDRPRPQLDEDGLEALALAAALRAGARRAVGNTLRRRRTRMLQPAGAAPRLATNAWFGSSVRSGASPSLPATEPTKSTSPEVSSVMRAQTCSSGR